MKTSVGVSHIARDGKRRMGGEESAPLTLTSAVHCATPFVDDASDDCECRWFRSKPAEKRACSIDSIAVPGILSETSSRTRANMVEKGYE